MVVDGHGFVRLPVGVVLKFLLKSFFRRVGLDLKNKNIFFSFLGCYQAVFFGGGEPPPQKIGYSSLKKIPSSQFQKVLPKPL